MASGVVALTGSATPRTPIASLPATTPEAIDRLHREGVRIVVLTGDSETTARTVAGQLGLDEVVAEVLPEQKADVVAGLQERGRVVAMAGDGVNDAPALARAHVGIAMGKGGSDVARDMSDVVLADDRLQSIIDAIAHGRSSFANLQ